LANTDKKAAQTQAANNTNKVTLSLQPPKCNHFPANAPTTILKAASLENGEAIAKKFKNWQYAEHQPPRPN
ncbi:hypothetical protein, partial [Photobacterium swingsii]|uniref:hypothetical protein n=1 Tax=Photobacterium swingsii TaxID=680026 RepID=UPI0040696604